MEALDDLAHALRAQLIERARSGAASGAAVEEEVRALVEREAARRSWEPIRRVRFH